MTTYSEAAVGLISSTVLAITGTAAAPTATEYAATRFDAVVSAPGVTADARLIGAAMQRAEVFGERPTQLTCANARCSRLAELPDVVLLNRNTIRLRARADGTYVVRVRSPRGGAVARWDSRTGTVNGGAS